MPRFRGKNFKSKASLKRYRKFVLPKLGKKSSSSSKKSFKNRARGSYNPSRKEQLSFKRKVIAGQQRYDSRKQKAIAQAKRNNQGGYWLDGKYHFI